MSRLDHTRMATFAQAVAQVAADHRSMGIAITRLSLKLESIGARAQRACPVCAVLFMPARGGQLACCKQHTTTLRNRRYKDTLARDKGGD